MRGGKTMMDHGSAHSSERLGFPAAIHFSLRSSLAFSFVYLLQERVGSMRSMHVLWVESETGQKTDGEGESHNKCSVCPWRQRARFRGGSALETCVQAVCGVPACPHLEKNQRTELPSGADEHRTVHDRRRLARALRTTESDLPLTQSAYAFCSAGHCLSAFFFMKCRRAAG